MKVSSPCVRKCKLDIETLICYGCGRTKDEITDWVLYTEDQRQSVMNRISKEKD